MKLVVLVRLSNVTADIFPQYQISFEKQGELSPSLKYSSWLSEHFIESPIAFENLRSGVWENRNSDKRRLVLTNFVVQDHLAEEDSGLFEQERCWQAKFQTASTFRTQNHFDSSDCSPALCDCRNSASPKSIGATRWDSETPHFISALRYWYWIFSRVCVVRGLYVLMNADFICRASRSKPIYS